MNELVPRHPRVCEYIGKFIFQNSYKGVCGEMGQTHMLAFEYCAGGDLRDAKLGANLPDVMQWGAEIAEGLAHLHRLKIVHRDIKPENVFLDKVVNGSAKLGDLGIAAKLEVDEHGVDKPMIAECGTDGFMSPEMESNCSDGYGLATDLYSLGATLKDLAVWWSRDHFLAKPFWKFVDRLMDDEPEKRPLATDAAKHLRELRDIFKQEEDKAEKAKKTRGIGVPEGEVLVDAYIPSFSDEEVVDEYYPDH